MNPLTPEHVQAIREQIGALPEDVSQEQIERTAQRLEGICYEPVLTREPPDYLRITKERLLSFVNELANASGEEEATEQDLNLLLHQYQFLQRLRQDDPTAWDEISELWEDD